MNCLSKNGILNLFSTDEITNIIVQILEINTQKMIPTVLISDGFSQSYAIFSDFAENQLKNDKIEQYSVIEIKNYTILKTKGIGKTIIINSFNLIHNDIDIIIGSPIDFSIFESQFYINLDGDNKIPIKKKIKCESEEFYSINFDNTAICSPKSKDINNIEKKLNLSPFFTYFLPIIDSKPIKSAKNLNEDKKIEIQEKKLIIKEEMKETPKFKAKILKKISSNINNQKNMKLELKLNLMNEKGDCLNAYIYDKNAEFYNKLLLEGEKYAFDRLNCYDQTIKENSNLYFSENSEVFPINDKNGSLSSQETKKNKGNLKNISEILENLRLGSICDVIGIITKIENLTEITTKKGFLTLKRSFIITNENSSLIKINLWGDIAKSFSLITDSVIILKKMRLQEYMGQKNLNNTDHTIISYEIDEIPYAMKLFELKKIKKIKN